MARAKSVRRKGTRGTRKQKELVTALVHHNAGKSGLA